MAGCGRSEERTDKRATRAPIVTTIDVGAEPLDVAVADGAVWVASHDDGTVTRVDARSGKVNGDPIRVGRGPTGVATADAVRVDRERR